MRQFHKKPVFRQPRRIPKKWVILGYRKINLERKESRKINLERKESRKINLERKEGRKINLERKEGRKITGTKINRKITETKSEPSKFILMTLFLGMRPLWSANFSLLLWSVYYTFDNIFFKYTINFIIVFKISQTLSRTHTDENLILRFCGTL